MVIMVYHTLQMHYSSPILTRLTYIITHVWMHYICMCMYIITYMCIYTDIHFIDLFMYYIHVSYISLYIYAVFFSVYVWVCVCEPVLYVRMKVWCGSDCETYLTKKKKKTPLSTLVPSPCSPVGTSAIFALFLWIGFYLIKPT